MFNIFKREKRIKAQIITQEFFNKEIIESKKPAIITFSAAWCGACKMQKPLINDLAHTHNESPVIIGFVDTDDQNELSSQFQIKGIPTTIVFKEGEIIFRKSGLLTRRNLEQLVTELNKTSS